MTHSIGLPQPDGRDERASQSAGSGDGRAALVWNVERELLAPLTIMRGYLALLRHGAWGALAPGQQQALWVITNHADEMQKRVDRMSVLLEAEAHTGANATGPVAPQVSAPSQVGPADPSPAAPANLLRPRRILVVDDEENQALTLQSGLKKLLHCEVEAVTCGEQALQLFERRPFDVLVTDYRMPDMDGLTLAARVRQLYPTTIIIMLTAFCDDTMRERARSVSIHCVLDKPMDLADTRAAILKALDGR